jgi:endo-1,3-1,4-beta-glycanase ExoK
MTKTPNHIVFNIFVFFFTSLILISSNNYSQNKSYKGAEVYGLSQYYVQYGKIEVRMMAATGSGILSTFFTWKEGSEQSSVFWEEIDVEVFGKNNATQWQSNLITGFDPRKTSEQVHNNNSSLGDEFHTYSVEWTPEYISWYLDGNEFRKTSTQSAKDIKSPAGIRFNLWSSTSTSWVGAWNDNILPQYQFVNWIKYYRYDNGNFILDWSDDFTEFNNNRWGKANWTFDGNRVDFDPNNVVVKDGMLILCLTKTGETGFSGTIPIDSIDISTEVYKINKLINQPNLKQNYPNPFNPHSIINFDISEGGNVSLKLYDILGKEIKVLLNDFKMPGSYQYQFDGSNLSNGVYLYTMQTGDFIETKKLLLLK